MLRNIIGQIFDAEKWYFFVFCFFCFFGKCHSPCRNKTILEKQKPKRGNFGQIVNSKKGNFWTDFQLYSVYVYACVYIYICVCMCVGVSLPVESHSKRRVQFVLGEARQEYLI